MEQATFALNPGERPRNMWLLGLLPKPRNMQVTKTPGWSAEGKIVE
jgi:hypothetical protein